MKSIPTRLREALVDMVDVEDDKSTLEVLKEKTILEMVKGEIDEPTAARIINAVDVLNDTRGLV